MAELGKPGATTDIVGVMVFGGDYPEYAEQRRRTRYAVVSALSTASFVPEQPEGLGFIMPSAGLERQRRVPFEWFRQRARPVACSCSGWTRTASTSIER